MPQEWMSIRLEENDLRIELLAGSVNVAKWGTKTEVKPVEVRWASLLDSQLETAKQFWFWLRIAIDLAEQIEKVIVSPEDFGRLIIYRTNQDKLAIVEMGDIFIMVPNSLNLIEK